VGERVGLTFSENWMNKQELAKNAALPYLSKVNQAILG
jgi:hypothetical protein